MSVVLFVLLLLFVGLLYFVSLLYYKYTRRKENVEKYDVEDDETYMVYTRSSKYAKEGGGECCAICLESFVYDDTIIRLPCMHVFHMNDKCNSISEWLKQKNTCPICEVRLS